MKIFTINEETEHAIDIGFTERYVKKLDRHLAQYSMSLMPRIETVDKKNFDLHFLVIGAKKSDTDEFFNFCSLRSTGPGEIRIKEKFLKSGKNFPKPLIFIYKKNKNKAVFNKLSKILESYYKKLVEVYKENVNKRCDLTQDRFSLNAAYKIKVNNLAKKLLIDVNKKAFAIDIKGVLLDEFFIHNSQKITFSERKLARSSLKVNNKLLDISEDSQPDISFPKAHYPEDPSLNKAHDKLCIKFSQELNNLAKTLITAYKKHLQRSEYKESLRFFSFRECVIHKSKVNVIKKLLSALEENPEAFINYLNEINENRILDIHRDCSVIEKIRCFLGVSNETKGRKLINNLLTVIEKFRFDARINFTSGYL